MSHSENYLNGLPSSAKNKEKKSEYSQLKSELVYPMQQLSVNDQQQEDGSDQVSYGTIQERMKHLRNATGTVLNATQTMNPAFPETPKPMVPTKPSFTSASSQSDAFEASLNPRFYASRRQQQQQQQQRQQQSQSPPQQKVSTPPPPPPPPMRQDNAPSTPPPAVPNSPRPSKPNSSNTNQNKSETMVRTLNPIYAGLECPACHKPIDGSVVSAMNQIWHVHCFTCATCHKPLENEKYYEKDDLPYCGKDYRNLFSLHCDFCHEPIEDVSYYQSYFFFLGLGNVVMLTRWVMLECY
jgi:hypothetical protein